MKEYLFLRYSARVKHIENPSENPEAQCLILMHNAATDLQKKRLPDREYRIKVKTL